MKRGNRRGLAKGLALTWGILLAGIVLTGARAPVQHTPELYVNDYAGVLTQSHREEILAVSRQLEKRTGAQLAVLTLPDLAGNDIADYAYQTAQGWGLGKAGEDNGVLLVLSIEDRLSRIEVGYGLEGTLTDILTGRIQDEFMLPYFSAGEYSAGLLEGTRAVAAQVYSHYGQEPPAGLPAVQQQTQEEYGWTALILPVLILILLLVPRRGGGGLLALLLLSGRGGRGGGPRGGGGTFGKGGGFGGGGSSRRF